MKHHREKLLILGLILFILISFSLRSLPIVTGDGHEYILMSEAFARHLSPDIRLDDIARQQELKFIDPNLLNNIADCIESKCNDTMQVFSSPKGGYFAIHFWFYSLITAPIKTFLSLFKINEFKAFSLTNALLVTVSVGYVVYTSKRLSSSIISAIFWFVSISLLYLPWPHPEVYSASLLFIACFAFLESKLMVCSVATALASLQNPSIIFFLPIFIIGEYLHRRGQNENHNNSFKDIYRCVFSFVVGVLIALIPYLFFFYYFQTGSLIAKTGFIDYGLISLDRLLSIFFDLNQGLIVGYPGITLGLILLIIFRCRNLILKKENHYSNKAYFLLLGTLIILIPTLGQTNWNSGQELFSRYAFWGGIPLVVFVSNQLDSLKPNGKYILIGFISFLQLWAVSFADYNYIELKPLSRYVIENFPGLYQPEPEIFVERILHQDWPILPKEEPIFYKNEDGEINLILKPKELTYTALVKAVCDQEQGVDLIDSNTNHKVLPDSFRSQKSWGNNQYVYISGRMRCSPSAATPVDR